MDLLSYASTTHYAVSPPTSLGWSSRRQSALLDHTVVVSHVPPTYGFVCEDGVDLCPEHDAGEEGEEKTFKHSKQGYNEHQRTRH